MLLENHWLWPCCHSVHFHSTTIDNILPVHSDKGSNSALSCKSRRSFINCLLVLLRYRLIRRYFQGIAIDVASWSFNILVQFFPTFVQQLGRLHKHFMRIWSRKWTLEVIAYHDLGRTWIEAGKAARVANFPKYSGGGRVSHLCLSN